jgi:hypothetical protein
MIAYSFMGTGIAAVSTDNAPFIDDGHDAIFVNLHRLGWAGCHAIRVCTVEAYVKGECVLVSNPCHTQARQGRITLAGLNQRTGQHAHLTTPADRFINRYWWGGFTL